MISGVSQFVCQMHSMFRARPAKKSVVCQSSFFDRKLLQYASHLMLSFVYSRLYASPTLLSTSVIFTRSILTVLLALYSALVFAAESVALLDVVNKLRASGHNIVYSDRFVHANMLVELEALDEVSIWDLEQLVRQFDLVLSYRSRTWYIAPAEGKSANTVQVPKRGLPSPASRELESIIVTGSRHRLADGKRTVSVTHLTESDLSNTPALGGDAFRIITRLPGVSSVGVSAKPHIRGGLQNELLVLSDGVELLEPFHLSDFQSIFSSLDYNTVESVDFYTGGFPVRYGTRISGVLDIKPHDDFETSSTTIDLSLFSANLNMQGNWLEDDSASWQLSMRESLLEHSLKQVNSQLGEPDYADLYGRVKIPLPHGDWAEYADLVFGVLYSQDDVSLTADLRAVSSDVRNYNFWTKLTADIDPQTTLKTTLAFTAQDKKKNGLSEEPEASLGFLRYRQRTRKLTASVDYARAFNSHKVEVGVRTDYGQSEYFSVAEIDRGVLAPVIGQPRQSDWSIQSKPTGWATAAYLAAEFELVEGLWLQPGLRWDRQNYYLDKARQQWSPRLSMRYQPSKSWTWHATVGQFHQAQAVHELQAIDGVERFVAPQRANQWVAGVTWSQGLSRFRAEAYRKDYRRPNRRFENLFNTFVLLPEIEPDRFEVLADSSSSKGIDLEYSQHFSEHWQLQLRYSYLRARETIDGIDIARRWQQRHAFNAISRWAWNNYQFSAAVSWHSGWRASQLPESVALGDTLPVAQLLNNIELRNYIALDIAAAKRWHWGKRDLQVYLNVSNLTNRANAAGLEYAPQVEQGQIELEVEREVLLPLIPNIGFRFTF